MMYVVYSAPNACYFVLLGDEIIPIYYQRSFRTKKELKDALKMCGLKLQRNKVVIDEKWSGSTY